MKAIINTYKIVKDNAKNISLLILLQALLSALASPLIIYYTKNVVDSIAGFASGQGDLKPIVILMVLFAWRELAKFIRNILDIKLEQRLEENLTTKVMKKLNNISMEDLENPDLQDKLNKIKSRPHMDIIELFNSSIAIVSIIVQVIGIALVFFSISIYLGITYLAFASLDSFMTFKAVSKMDAMFENTSHNEREMDNILRILKDKDALYEIKVFQMKNLFLSKYKTYSDAVFDERLKTTISSQKFLLYSSAITILWFILAIVFVILKLLAQTISIGSVTAVITSAANSIDIAEELVYEASTIANSGYMANTLALILSHKEKEEINQDISASTIDFVNVSFSYPGSGELVFDNLNLSINKDKITAIVGDNGAGKTTLVKLAAGLYKPNSGKVLLAGADPNLLSYQALSQEMAIVFQDFQNFQLSIKDNINLGKDYEINNALELMGLDKYDGEFNIGKLEEDGVYLSGGENQKLAICRALAKNSDFLIFDEPTASMDPLIEARMYEDIIKILEDRGAIIITHRLVLSRLADEIIVLDKGRVIERGNHETLMQAKGKYYRMYQKQASWYKEDSHA